MMYGRWHRFCTLLTVFTVLGVTLSSTPAVAVESQLLPGYRTAFGAVWPIDSPGVGGVSFDALIRVSLTLGEERNMHGFMLDPVLGYNYQNPGNETHLLVLGTDLGYSFGPYVAVSVGTRGVVGSDAGGFTAGLRNVVAVDSLFGILRAEATHQVLWQKGQSRQSLGFMVGFDVLRTVGIFLFSSQKKRRRR